MSDRLQFNFSHSFEGTIWRSVTLAEQNLLILEVRNEDKRETRFSAFDYSTNTFRWKDVLFEENWWIGITAAASGIALFHIYTNTENPDEKTLIAFDVNRQEIIWKHDQFAFSSLEGNFIKGIFADNGEAIVTLDLFTGKILKNVVNMPMAEENILVRTPFQYLEGQPHFETVKSFLRQQMDTMPVGSIEYLEFNSLIFISYHVQSETLTNYLVVLNENGTEEFKTELGDHLKGIGFETFFILSGCLFFVRNKGELVSFRIV